MAKAPDLAAALQRIEPYLRHHAACFHRGLAVWYGDEETCDCGLSADLALLVQAAQAGMGRVVEVRKPPPFVIESDEPPGGGERDRAIEGKAVHALRRFFTMTTPQDMAQWTDKTRALLADIPVRARDAAAGEGTDG